MLQTEFLSLVGTIARRTRIRAGVGIKALSGRSGLHKSRIYALENGRRFTPLTLARIELALGVPVWPIDQCIAVKSGNNSRPEPAQIRRASSQNGVRSRAAWTVSL